MDTIQTPMKDVRKHGDFKAYYDTVLKANYWVLGYFGGGSINVSDAHEAALQFADATGLPYGSIQIDEIHTSRRYKGFKFMRSTKVNQEPMEGAERLDYVMSYLED